MADTAAEHSPMLMRGPSMWPTLQAGDLLEVVPPGRWRAVLVGDVVCRAGDDVDVVHRVVARRAAPGGRVLLRTRVDNNTLFDAQPVSADALHGIVIGAWRDGRRIRVRGGTAGLLVHLRFRLTRGPLRPLREIARLLYLAAARRGGLSRLLPAAAAPRVVRTGSGAGETLRVLFGGRVVGRFARRRGYGRREGERDECECDDGPQGRWVIRPPYRLLIDERRLPRPGGPQAHPGGPQARPRPDGARTRRAVIPHRGRQSERRRGCAP